MFNASIRNENNIKLTEIGKKIVSKYSRTHANYFKPSNHIHMIFESGEDFKAEFSREENGIRIYNAT